MALVHNAFIIVKTQPPTHPGFTFSSVHNPFNLLNFIGLILCQLNLLVVAPLRPISLFTNFFYQHLSPINWSRPHLLQSPIQNHQTYLSAIPFSSLRTIISNLLIFDKPIFIDISFIILTKKQFFRSKCLRGGWLAKVVIQYSNSNRKKKSSVSFLFYIFFLSLGV